MTRVVVVGAGIGGLSTAAVLAKAGLDVTVLEAHVYPGGCASTFFHQGYRFDAGATLAAGFYPGGPMDTLAHLAGIGAWPVRPTDLALTVHLPHGEPIHRWADPARWKSERAKLGRSSERFWEWQQATAEVLWGLASHLPPWPPVTLTDLMDLTRLGLRTLGRPDGRIRFSDLAADAIAPIKRRLPADEPSLRLFVDGQLLISAQTTSAHANALYGAAALDLPRRGVVEVEGGMGAIARTLAQSVEAQGGRVCYRQEVRSVRMQSGRPVAVVTRHGESVPADLLVLNLTPWDAAALLGDPLPRILRRRRDGWGAFTVYAGIDAAGVPDALPLHHQIIVDEPLGEGNSVFLSISPAWDTSRAPHGRRAITLSTHTRPGPWWELKEDQPAYEQRKASYTERMLVAAERVIPRLREAAPVILSGTPITFERFTRRREGWVGGFPQTSLFRTLPPRLAPGVWLVGDAIFPGQSVAAAALGGMRVAEMVVQEVRQQ